MKNSFIITGMNRIFTLLTVSILLFFSACATANLNIPENLSPAELIQRAQEASDRNRYNQALQYYQALHDRNSDNMDLICEAEYEIAFIHYKQKNYSIAREEFNALLERYNGLDAEDLPIHFKLLSNKVLEKLEEKDKKGISRKKDQ